MSLKFGDDGLRRVIEVTRYRSRATSAGTRRALLAIVTMLALIGGLSMAAIAGARRTQSSFPAYLARTNASDLSVGTALYDPPIDNLAYDPALVAAIAAVPHVKQVASSTGVDPNIVPLVPLTLHIAPGQTPPILVGSLDGDFTSVDRVTITAGRLADPTKADEMIMSASAAAELGMHVGSVLPMGFVTNEQLQQPDCCDPTATGALAPHLKVNLRLVGIAVFNTELLQDDVDALADNPVVLSKALIQQLAQCCAFYTQTAVRVDGGARNVPTVLASIKTVPKLATLGAFNSVVLTSATSSKAERAIEPESIALGVFGAIAGLAALLIAGQLIARQIRLGRDDRAVLRSLGAEQAILFVDCLLGVLAAVLLGALLAAIVAVAASPLAPLGPVRRVEHPSVAVDWTVLGLGVAVLLAVSSTVAVIIARREATRRSQNRPRRRVSALESLATASAARPTALTGVRFAVESGPGADAATGRSTIVAASLAVAILTATLTFAASLSGLVSHPSLYGWNWNFEMLSGFSGQEDLPEQQITTLLDNDPYVSSWSGVYFGSADIDGQSVPILGTDPQPSVVPPVLSGRSLNAADEIVLGPSTLAQLHKHIGDTVQVSAGLPHPTALRIVGTATMPAIGNQQFHTTMGTGALLSYNIIPAEQRNLQKNTEAGPQAILVRTRPGVDATLAERSLQQINVTINKSPESPAGGVVSLLRPAEIVNYRSMGTTPILFGAALALGAVAALALTLIASVRRRQRDLALLRALGFTRRQLAAVVAWQSTITVSTGIVVGMPIGLIGGRFLWDRFAGAIDAVPHSTIPWLAMVLTVAGALTLGNLVALIPARNAARTSIQPLLANG